VRGSDGERREWGRKRVGEEKKRVDDECQSYVRKTLCNTLQHIATHCNRLQYAAKYCNTSNSYGVMLTLILSTRIIFRCFREEEKHLCGRWRNRGERQRTRARERERARERDRESEHARALKRERESDARAPRTGQPCPVVWQCVAISRSMFKWAESKTE